MDTLRSMVDSGLSTITVVRQCELIGLSRASLYYQPKPINPENLELMHLLDQQYTETPFYGYRRMTDAMKEKGFEVNAKRVRRLLREMGLEAVYPKPRTTIPAPGHKVFPYLLRGVTVSKPGEVWCSDITYIRLRQGFLYLVAIMDWFSRYVLTWELSNTLDAEFCVSALTRALRMGTPGIFNTDQGCQFTSAGFTQPLLDAGVNISMDGRGRALDNVFIERLWRSVKYEEVYLADYDSGAAAWLGLQRYFEFYNVKRPHKSLGKRTPKEVYLN